MPHPPATPAPSPRNSVAGDGGALAHPIVLLHGGGGFETIRLGRLRIEYYRGVAALFEAAGSRVHAWRVPNLAHVEERARRLLARLRQIEKTGPFNLIAHSMGGLDARCLISALGGADLVASLTTIATPHLGTEAAEWRNRWLGRCGFFRRGLSSLNSVEGGPVARFMEIFTRDWSARFSDLCPDVHHVRYRTWAGDAPLWGVCPVIQPTWWLIHRREGPNDGLVSVASARWKDEYFAGTVRADHFAQLGWKLGLNRFDGFDHLDLYRRILRDLAEAGL